MIVITLADILMLVFLSLVIITLAIMCGIDFFKALIKKVKSYLK